MTTAVEINQGNNGVVCYRPVLEGAMKCGRCHHSHKCDVTSCGRVPSDINSLLGTPHTQSVYSSRPHFVLGFHLFYFYFYFLFFSCIYLITCRKEKQNYPSPAKQAPQGWKANVLSMRSGCYSSTCIWRYTLFMILMFSQSDTKVTHDWARFYYLKRYCISFFIITE